MQSSKQTRNGVPGPAATHNTAQPGPVADVPVAEAMAAGNARARVTYGPPPLDQGVRAWDQGLAVRDVEGGGSG